MECFICDSTKCEDLSICNVKTKYQKIPITLILYDFIGSDFEIAIGNEDRICEMCKNVFDELDLLRYKLNNIENIFSHKLHRKYQFDRTKELPIIRLDEQTANCFINGQQGQKFQCVKCSYSTDFVDCLTPHSLLHRIEHTIQDFQINEFSCETCHLILPSECLFKEHILLFHSSRDDRNDIASENILDSGDVDRVDVDLELAESLSHKSQQNVECTVSILLCLFENNLIIFF